MANLQEFGGDWTETKLELLSAYLRAYTKALLNTSFSLIYIDAFAGTGYRQLDDSPHKDQPTLLESFESRTQRFLDGSVVKALEVKSREFNEFVLIEKDPAKCRELEKLRPRAGNRAFTICNGDANEELRKFVRAHSWHNTRAVLFLDPFGTEVEWETIKAVAKTRCIDTWILFPIGIVQRLMPRGVSPESIDPKWKARLDTVFGTSDWKTHFYVKTQVEDLFGGVSESESRTGDQYMILDYFVQRLKEEFVAVAPKPKLLLGPTNSPLYAFCFAAGREDPALKIARHITERL